MKAREAVQKTAISPQTSARYCSAIWMAADGPVCMCFIIQEPGEIMQQGCLLLFVLKTSPLVAGEKISKAIPVTGRRAHRIVRRRGSHIFYTIGSQMAMRLSALRAGRPLPTGRFLVIISVALKTNRRHGSKQRWVVSFMLPPL
jgi:hypothetical protein